MALSIKRAGAMSRDEWHSVREGQGEPLKTRTLLYAMNKVSSGTSLPLIFFFLSRFNRDRSVISRISTACSVEYLSRWALFFPVRVIPSVELFLTAGIQNFDSTGFFREAASEGGAAEAIVTAELPRGEPFVIVGPGDWRFEQCNKVVDLFMQRRYLVPRLLINDIYGLYCHKDAPFFLLVY